MIRITGTCLSVGAGSTREHGTHSLYFGKSEIGEDERSGHVSGKTTSSIDSFGQTQ